MVLGRRPLTVNCVVFTWSATVCQLLLTDWLVRGKWGRCGVWGGGWLGQKKITSTAARDSTALWRWLEQCQHLTRSYLCLLHFEDKYVHPLDINNIPTHYWQLYLKSIFPCFPQYRLVPCIQQNFSGIGIHVDTLQAPKTYSNMHLGQARTQHL